jgi:hypothetical protein
MSNFGEAFGKIEKGTLQIACETFRANTRPVGK